MIKIKSAIGIPKYKQIIIAIEDAITSGDLKKGDLIPSLNKIKNDNNLSRDTVVSAFNELKNRGIIKSIVGKGYYVSSENIEITKNIFLLFDELNAFKEDLYNAFLEHLGANIKVDIYFHHFNRNTFEKLIRDSVGNYNYYVIMPANFKNTAPIVAQLPENNVYILDQLHDDLKAYPAIYQNFEKAICENLLKVLHLIKNYEKLILVFSAAKQPVALLNGCTRFCKTHQIPIEIIDDLNERMLKKGELYITTEDKSLLQIIKRLKVQNLELVKDIGVIAYNETLLKEVVEGGITTITTNFEKMGKDLARMILNKVHLQVENPNQLILRNSL